VLIVLYASQSPHKLTFILLICYVYVTIDVLKGVSSPANVGLTAQEALDICYLAGQNRKVCLFDLSEFNPLVEDYRTGKLVATMFYYFALGFTHRKL
jgi:arginase family enzyme